MATRDTAILDALGGRLPQFRGTSWQPRDLILHHVATALLRMAKPVVDEILALPLEGLPTSSRLERWQYRIGISYDYAVLNRTRDQRAFLRHIGRVVEEVGLVYDELHRLERMGQFASLAADPAV